MSSLRGTPLTGPQKACDSSCGSSVAELLGIGYGKREVPWILSALCGPAASLNSENIAATREYGGGDYCIFTYYGGDHNKFYIESIKGLLWG